MIDNETQNFGSLPKRKPEVRPSSVKFTMLYKIFKIWANIVVIWS